MTEHAGTIPALVLAAGERFGDRHAIEDGAVTLTYRELAAAGLRATRAFVAAGIRRGDRVAIWAPNIHEWVIAAIGLQSAGGVLVPLNTRMKGREVGYILEKSGARILCAVEEFLGNRYLELLRDACGGAGSGRPIANLPALERIIVLPEPREGGEGVPPPKWVGASAASHQGPISAGGLPPHPPGTLRARTSLRGR